MSRLRFNTAQEVFETFPSARRLIATAPTREHPLAFLRALAGSDAPNEALGFCAFLLPRREAVWWGVQALKMMLPPGARPDAGLIAAEAWAREPDDARRRAALALGEAGDTEEPGTWIAFAAGYSGGSMVATHAVPCPPDMTAKTVRIAVLSAYRRLPAAGRAAALRSCVEACIRLADDDSHSTRP